MLTVSPRGPAREQIARLSRGKGCTQTPLISIAGLSRAPRGESGPRRISPLGYDYQRGNLLDVSMEGEKGLAWLHMCQNTERFLGFIVGFRVANQASFVRDCRFVPSHQFDLRPGFLS
jgi:hypothetical protein